MKLNYDKFNIFKFHNFDLLNNPNTLLSNDFLINYFKNYKEKQ